MIQTIAEHLIDPDLLKPGSLILDLGCRNFQFTEAMRALGHKVHPVDCDILSEGKAYYRCAISDHNGKAGIARSADPQATRIESGDEVECYTIEDFSSMIGIRMWGLIKCDLEGEELKIIRSMTRPLSKIFTCEFHLHTGIYGQPEVDEMVTKLQSLGYEIASHELTDQHGAGPNYWSSLFILKK